jgi:putative membrane protein
MNILSSILILVIAILHIFFLVLEMFLWTKPLGLKVFRQNLQQAEASKVLAANQGLYNGFLVAGLFWSLLETNPAHALSLKIFFLSCVFIAGLFGAKTVSRRIFWIQACPAAITLILVLFI